MSTYRKMRRQARQARRSGLQPMMVINQGDGFPEPVGVFLGRLTWRYRSELAPVAVVATLMGGTLVLHATRPQWWAYVFSVTDLTAWSLILFGARVGLIHRMERLYAGAVILASGTWAGYAVALGPLMSPLPQLIGLGAVVLSVPWWAHRRRRAKVRVERKLEAWPDIAKAIGLAGSQVMSAIVDVWGWRARLRLARGQTLNDVIAKIPQIESGLGAFRGAVRVYPTPDDLANRCEIRVLDIDPHAGAIPWPGPSVSSITEPVDLGPFEDASPCRILFLRRHALFGGTTGSGKSGGLNVLMGNLVACRDVVIWGIDLKRGMELGPWRSCIDRLAATPEEAVALLRDAVSILQARASLMATMGRREWEPSQDRPALIIVIDEYAELKDEAPEAMEDTDSIARLGRALAVTLTTATQRPTQKAMGEGAVRSQSDIRLCFRVRERKDGDLVLGQGMLSSGWDAQALNAPGKFLVSAQEHDTPRRARAYLLTDQAVTETAARYADTRPGLDEVSRQAITISAESATNAVHVSAEIDESANADPTTDDALWLALVQAPDGGTDISDLMRITGWKRTKLYRHLQEHAKAGRAIQIGRGRWRAHTNDDSSL